MPASKWLTHVEHRSTPASPSFRTVSASPDSPTAASIPTPSSSPSCTPALTDANLEHGWFLRQGWGARTYRRAKPPFNTRGFSRFWGDGVSVDAVAGWGDVDAGRVLYVRVQVGTELDDVNSRWLSGSLGLSALSAKRLTRMSPGASKRGRKKFESRLGVQA